MEQQFSENLTSATPSRFEAQFVLNFSTTKKMLGIINENVEFM
ncbi:BnaC03g64880D [Brassica napus]|uniref:BnaC03g64880D protein n=2 Tax=Brassica napus TaxID=3708 RepID=A0A078GS65_BRANA|nr:BnaC03g64880D [Brassica napus]